MILFIDTGEAESVRFALINKQGKGANLAQKKFSIPRSANHTTLAHLENFLRAKKIAPKDVTKIMASSGPGSFNGIRAGLSIAQALALAWNIPFKAIPADETAKLLRPVPRRPKSAK